VRASCHGARLEGQARWWEPGVDGMLAAPPHDAAGLTWQHLGRELIELIAYSVQSLAPRGYRTAMPAPADRRSGGQAGAVIACIKSIWPAGIRAYQTAQSPGSPSLAELPGDLVFPARCGYRL